jgi:hypothetical protein
LASCRFCPKSPGRTIRPIATGRRGRGQKRGNDRSRPPQAARPAFARGSLPLIVYLLTRLARHTLGRSLQYFPDELRQRIRIRSYGSILAARELPVATYIFSDVERMRPEAKIQAARIWLALEQSGRPVRLLNHPIRAMRRPELLRSLYERGINSFNAYPARRPPATMRYPVFLRGAYDHDGPRTDLIHDRATLEAEIARLEASGLPRELALIVEFCDTKDADGLYRKYDAFIGDGEIFPTEKYFSSRWILKWGNNRVFDGIPVDPAALTHEELIHARDNRHRDQLLRACAPTHIGYGRIDYALLGDRVQVWEINSNPDLLLEAIHTPEKLDSAYGREVLPLICESIFQLFRSLDSVPEETAPIPVDLSAMPA